MAPERLSFNEVVNIIDDFDSEGKHPDETLALLESDQYILPDSLKNDRNKLISLISELTDDP